MAEFLSKAEVIWFLVGLVLIVSELAVPGFVLIFFGVGAWVTAIVCLFFGIELNTQLLVFLGSSLLSLALLRRVLKKRYMDRKMQADDPDDEYIGQTAIALNSFAAGQTGKVSFKGSSWNAESSQAVTEGQRLRIMGHKSIKLFVEPIQ